MNLFTRRLSPHVFFIFIVLLLALPIVRADYLSTYWRIQQAFVKFTIPIHSSRISEEAHLDTHDDELLGNYTLYDEAVVQWENGILSDEQLNEQTDAAIRGIEFSYYQLLADYMGVGVQSSCREPIEAALEGAREWDRAGQQAASLIMALLPSLLTFGLSSCSNNSES